MGMVYVLRRATDEQLLLLRRRPELIERFLLGEPRESASEETGLIGKIVSPFSFRRPEQILGGVREEGDEVDLDKSWHLLHFLLTGSAAGTEAPESTLLQDWPEIGDVQIGWGRAWAIHSGAIRRFDEALKQIRDEDLFERFDPAEMTRQDVYLGDAFEGDEKAGCEYVLEYLLILRTFVSEAARRGCGAIGYLT
jgi:hypothetical protein